MNNENDGYNSWNREWLTQSGVPVPKDPDLLPLQIIPGGVPAGLFSLNIPENANVWTPITGMSPVISGDQIGQWPLVVEAAGNVSGELELNWSDGFQTFNDTASQKVQSFIWNGPPNIPGNSQYDYTGVGGSGEQTWINAPGARRSCSHTTARSPTVFGPAQ